MLTAAERRHARTLVDLAARARVAEQRAAARGLRAVPDLPAVEAIREDALEAVQAHVRRQHGKVLRIAQQETTEPDRDREVAEAFTLYPAIMARFLAVMPPESTIDRELHAARAARVASQAHLNATVPWPLRAAGAVAHTSAGRPNPVAGVGAARRRES